MKDTVWTGREPTLREMLEDPLVRLLMDRDRVTREDLLAVLHGARTRLGFSASESDAA